jgi:hypothetical protein
MCHDIIEWRVLTQSHEDAQGQKCKSISALETIVIRE